MRVNALSLINNIYESDSSHNSSICGIVHHCDSCYFTALLSTLLSCAAAEWLTHLHTLRITQMDRKEAERERIIKVSFKSWHWCSFFSITLS